MPVVDDAELDTLIEQKTALLLRQLDTSTDVGARSSGVRGQVVVQFFEKKRKKMTWFAKGEDIVCWEQWTLDVTLASPRTENGTLELPTFPLHEALIPEYRGRSLTPCRTCQGPPRHGNYPP